MVKNTGYHRILKRSFDAVKTFRFLFLLFVAQSVFAAQNDVFILSENASGKKVERVFNLTSFGEYWLGLSLADPGADRILFWDDSAGTYGFLQAGTNLTINDTVLDAATGGGGGSGTVTSVGLSAPAIFSVTGTPVTTSGTIDISLQLQSANRVWAGPTTGSATPSFRTLEDSDIPSFIARDSEVAAAYQPLNSNLSTLAAAGNSSVLAATTASFLTTDETKLDGIEAGATTDQTDSEIEIAYNNQVAIVSQAVAEAGTSTTVFRWTPQRVAQAIAALETGGGTAASISFTPTGNIAATDVQAALAEVDTEKQPANANLDDLADGSLTGTKVGFADTNSNFTATDVQSAIEELDNVNGSGPNAADGKVSWSQIVDMPAGFADGSDDGAGGGGGTLNTIQEDGVAVGDPDIVTLNFDTGFDLVESPNTKITVSLDPLEMETPLEAVLDLQDLQGAVTDGQVPDSITITLAGTATALATARTIGGVSFDGTANIVPQTIQVVDSTDATSSVAIFDSATGNLQPKTDAGITYDATTGTLSATAVQSGGTAVLVAGGVDISSDTNLAGDSEIVLTGDALSIASGITRDTELDAVGTRAGVITATGFNGNLATTDDTLQEVAQKVDDLTFSGSFGETSLAGLANNQTLWDSASASRTLTFGLSGATDPVLTASNGVLNLSTGTLQEAGSPVLTQGDLGTNVLTWLGTPSSSNLASAVTGETGSGALVFGTSPTIATPTINGAIAFPDGTRQTFNPDATNAGLNVGSQAGDPSTPSNGDLWYDSTANELTARINGSNVALGSGGGSGDVTAASAFGTSDVVIVSDGTGKGVKSTSIPVTGGDTLNPAAVNADTFSILDNVDQSNGLSIVANEDLAADINLNLDLDGASRNVNIQGNVVLPAGTAVVTTDIGSSVQAYDADLTTFAGITPSANVQSLLGAADYAAMRTLLDLEAGTDFYSISAANAAFQPLDADLTAIAALTGTNNIYYRSAADTWSSVTIGSGLAFSAGTLSATGGSFDATAIDSITWSDGANASNVWTFDLSGTDPTITFNSGAVAIGGNLTATNLSGTNTGDQTSVSGNAGTATVLQTARSIGNVSFDGSADIVPQTVQVVDSTDATSSVAIFDSATGNLQLKTDTGLAYDATTGTLNATVVQTGGTPTVANTRTVTVAGTTNEISSSAGAQDLSANRTWTLSLPATIDLGGKTSFELPNGAAPTVDAFGEIAGDNDLWAVSRGAPVFFDGTAAVALVGTLVSDTPTNGQVPKWNTGGTITWEDDATGTGFGETSLSTLANNQTLWDSASASRTLTFGLSGATDPVFTASNGVVNLSTGELQQGGSPVVLDSDIGSTVQTFDADLTALAALTGTNNIYYRSAADTWSSVTIGSGLTFSAGTLSATSSGFDSTTVDSTTWSDGANASNTWTFDVSGAVDPMLIFSDNLIATNAQLGAFGLTNDTGALLFSGYGNTNNENLIFDFESTANTIGVFSTSGVTSVNFGSIGLTANLTGNASTATTLLGGQTDTWIIAISDTSSAITLGTKYAVEIPYAATITAIRATVTTAPAGTNMIMDVSESTTPTGGTSVMTTNKCTIETTEVSTRTATTQPTVTDTTLAAGNWLVFDVDQADNGTARGLAIQIDHTH